MNSTTAPTLTLPRSAPASARTVFKLLQRLRLALKGVDTI